MNKTEQKNAVLVGQSQDLLVSGSKLGQLVVVCGIFCSPDAQLPDGMSRLGEVADAPQFLLDNPSISMVCCAMTGVDVELIRDVERACKVRGVRFTLALPLVDELETRFVRKSVSGCSLLTNRREPLSCLHNRVLKRTVDLLVTCIILLTAFPLVSLYKVVKIKRQQKAPSTVTDRCCGPNGRVFNRVSFRFDENSWARLLNVLTGSMSLVGPQCYKLTDGVEVKDLPKRLERKNIKSGLFSLKRGAYSEPDERLESDVYYAEHWSLWLDIKILMRSMLR